MLMDILPLALDLLIILVNRGDIMLQQLYQPRGRRLLSGVDAKSAFNRMPLGIHGGLTPGARRRRSESILDEPSHTQHGQYLNI
jgi:hypothetical protein